MRGRARDQDGAAAAMTTALERVRTQYELTAAEAMAILAALAESAARDVLREERRWRRG